jgi:hypothetical protein
MIGPTVDAHDLKAKACEHDRKIGTGAPDVEHFSVGRKAREDERALN